MLSENKSSLIVETPAVDPYTPVVSRVFRVESIDWGDDHRKYLVRYRGRLYSEDSAEAYDRLAASLYPLDVTPMFLSEKREQSVVLVRGVHKAQPASVIRPLIFFLLTVASVIVSMYMFSGSLTDAIMFAAALMAILLAHEFGHYLVARLHKTAATLPYFIPFPILSPFGTMGAVIVQKEAHKNRRVLLDIGMAGPLAGFVVALPLLLLGLYLSNVEQIVPVEGMMASLEGNSLLYLAAKYAVFGRLLPEPSSMEGLSTAAYWLQFFFTGKPYPLYGVDVMLHPIAYAAWAGLLVTALNLIPAGQLDGGHIVNSLFGKRARLFLPFVLGALVLLGLAWSGWWLWAFLIFFLGRVYAEPLDQITQLDAPRKLMAVLCLVLLILVFTPVPLQFFVF